jgi:iron(III) transport system ATP-binding protein
MVVAVRLDRLSKSYGSLGVLKDLSLDVRKGSFTSLLGPSGCGKTTLLNMIGGLDQPTSGNITLDDEMVFSSARDINVPPEKRNLGYVFQSYALWPHMTVLQNIGFSMKIRKVAKAERDRRSREMLEKLELDSLAERYPYQLSGGQQQRVAIARALVYRPRLLLLDEPLSNLDAQLRERARTWLKNVHETFKLTTILVTHDQIEALSLSDEIVLLNSGEIEQVGRPAEIYDYPRTAYAADFVGAANIISGELVSMAGEGKAIFKSRDGTILHAQLHEPLPAGTPISVAIRPQKVTLVDSPSAPDTGGQTLPFEVRTVLYQGSTYEIIGDTPVGLLRILSSAPPSGKSAYAYLSADACYCVSGTHATASY